MSKSSFWLSHQKNYLKFKKSIYSSSDEPCIKYMLKQFFGLCGEIIAIEPDKDEVNGKLPFRSFKMV
jgi:hypothetical protein